MTRRRLPTMPGRDRWMVSYLDVLTILLIFFLTAAAKTWKNQPLAAPALTQASTQTQASSAQVSGRAISDPALADVERMLKREGLDVRGPGQSDSDSGGDPAQKRGLTISLPQAVFFSPGDDRIRADALPTLEKIAAALRDLPNKVNLAGHADAVPIHNGRFRNNWELAAARSLRLMEVLTVRYRIDESRVSISSYGSAEPSNPNDTAGGRAGNRRVEILVLSERAAP